MIDAQIRRIDVPARTAVVVTGDGREVVLRFHGDSNIEVNDPATTGLIGGSLADLREGYWVRVAFDAEAEGACHCSALVSVS